MAANPRAVPGRSVWWATAPRSCRAAPEGGANRRGDDQTSATTAELPPWAWRWRSDRVRREEARGVPDRARASMAEHVRPGWGSPTPVRRSSTTGTRSATSAAGRVRAGLRLSGFVPLHPPLFCAGKGPFRWPRCTATRRTSSQRQACWTCSGRRPAEKWLRRPATRSASRACRPDLLARLRGAGPSRAGVQRPGRLGKVTAPWSSPRPPRCGSVASPTGRPRRCSTLRRIADWPLLNALINTRPGDWVSIHTVAAGASAVDPRRPVSWPMAPNWRPEAGPGAHHDPGWA